MIENPVNSVVPAMCEYYEKWILTTRDRWCNDSQLSQEQQVHLH